MQIDLNTLVAVGIPMFGGLIWLLRLEGRVNLNEAIVKGIKGDVEYIRERIDTALDRTGMRP